MEIKTINITLPSTKEKKQIVKQEQSKANFSLHGFVEVPYNLLVHLHGSWLKYYDITNKNYYSGGFLQSCDFLTSVPTISLRIPSKSEVIEIEIKNKKFFIKKDVPNYIALQELVCCKCKEKIN
jgi:hypothetical protein